MSHECRHCSNEATVCDACRDFYADGCARSERLAIARWLRLNANRVYEEDSVVIMMMADEIENGEHL